VPSRRLHLTASTVRGAATAVSPCRPPGQVRPAGVALPARGHARLKVAAPGKVATSVTRREDRPRPPSRRAPSAAPSPHSGPRRHQGALFTAVLLQTCPGGRRLRLTPRPRQPSAAHEGAVTRPARLARSAAGLVPAPHRARCGPLPSYSSDRRCRRLEITVDMYSAASPYVGPSVSRSSGLTLSDGHTPPIRQRSRSELSRRAST